MAKAKKTDPLQEQLDIAEAKLRASEYLGTLIHMIRREVEMATHAHNAALALKKALLDVFPDRASELESAFHKRFAYETRHGEISVITRQIVSELDKAYPQGRYGS